MAWTTPRTWNIGELITKAIMDTHIRDNLTYLKTVVDLLTVLTGFVVDYDYDTNANYDHSDFSASTWRDVPGSSKSISIPEDSTIITIGFMNEYGTGTYAFRKFKFSIEGTDIDTMVSDLTYWITNKAPKFVMGIKTGVSAGNVTVALREYWSTAGYHVDSWAWIALVIPETP